MEGMGGVSPTTYCNQWFNTETGTWSEQGIKNADYASWGTRCLVDNDNTVHVIGGETTKKYRTAKLVNGV